MSATSVHPTAAENGQVLVSDDTSPQEEKWAGGRMLGHATAAPGPTDGANGDYWIRVSTKGIYGPKAAGTWPAVIGTLT